jgi:hypothetical protein
MVKNHFQAGLNFSPADVAGSFSLSGFTLLNRLDTLL